MKVVQSTKVQCGTYLSVIDIHTQFKRQGYVANMMATIEEELLARFNSNHHPLCLCPPAALTPSLSASYNKRRWITLIHVFLSLLISFILLRDEFTLSTLCSSSSVYNMPSRSIYNECSIFFHTKLSYVYMYIYICIMIWDSEWRRIHACCEFLQSQLTSKGPVSFSTRQYTHWVALCEPLG